MRVLVIEDERSMAELLRQGLSEEDHVVTVSNDGAQGLEMARASEFDAIVLDVMLPHVDGITIAKKLREENNRTPVLMLTAKDGAHDIVTGLDVGADDYLTKPFSFEVFLARLRAVARRGPIAQPTCLKIADLKMDCGSHQVIRNGRQINLSPREYRLLELLLRNAGRVVTRETILESIWGFDTEVSENTIEAFVRLLRLKIDVDEPKLIHTVRGFGYCVRLE